MFPCFPFPYISLSSMSRPRPRRNISPATRALILKTGYKLQTPGRKVKYTEIQRAIGTMHQEDYEDVLATRVIKKWWDQRGEFEQTARLSHRKRSGRPVHPAFCTPQRLDDVITFMLNLKDGQHQIDVMKHFDIKSKHTVIKHTKKYAKWVFPPQTHANDNADVQQKRVDYAEWAATRSYKPTKLILERATFIDHKCVPWFGSNRTHHKQFKLLGDTTANLTDLKYLLKSPHLMTYFACNMLGIEHYIHATPRPKERGSGLTVDVWKVSEDDCIEAWEERFIPFMKETYSDYVICDGCKMQHTKAVKDLLEDNHIQLHPSACRPHNVRRGYPPYSHCFMPLDYRVFSKFQEDIHQQTMQMEEEFEYDLHTDNRLSRLYDIIEDTWHTSDMEVLARNTILQYGDISRRVVIANGRINDI